MPKWFVLQGQLVYGQSVLVILAYSAFWHALNLQYWDSRQDVLRHKIVAAHNATKSCPTHKVPEMQDTDQSATSDQPK